MAARSTSRVAHVPRSDAEQSALAELTAWRTRAVPDERAPLDADDLVRLLRDCVATLGLDPEIANVSVNTVHYYRRKDIIDPPVGKTAAARYEIRHLWQVAGARLAGALGLVTLAEARDVIRGADRDAAMSFLAARVADARARAVVKRQAAPDAARRPLPETPATHRPTAVSEAAVIQLPGSAMCVLPSDHPARSSPDAARALGDALVAALTYARSH